MKFEIHTFRADEGFSLPKLAELTRKAYAAEVPSSRSAVLEWMHLANPAGASQFTVALTSDSDAYLCAVGMWRGRYQAAGDDLNVGGIVQTATAPEAQGKGLFRKVFLQYIHDMSAVGVQHMHGFANAQAYPIYQKLGIQKIGQLALHVRPRLRLRSRERLELVKATELSTIQNDARFAQKAADAVYLAWRFDASPLSTYRAVRNAEAGLIYRARRRHGIRFLEIQHLRLPRWSPQRIAALVDEALIVERAQLATVRLLYPSIPSEILRQAGFVRQLGDMSSSGVIGIDYPPIQQSQLALRSWWRLTETGDADW